MMKIALFRDVISGHTFIREPLKYPSSTDIRVSEFVEVTFPPIPAALEVVKTAETFRERAKQILDDYHATVVESAKSVN